MDNLVSVIIPNYNHARYLDERISSVLNQSYQNIEVIILDDCSTDTSCEVIDKYKHNPKIKHIIYNVTNSGSTFIQWHKGFELAKGDVIWIAESDDSCDSSMLEKLLMVYMKGETSIAFCRSLTYTGKPPYSKFPSQDALDGSFLMDGDKFISQYMVYDNRISNTSSAIFDKNIALSLDKLYMQMKGNGDWMFWIEMCEQGKVAFLDEPLNLFRQHPLNTTKKLIGNGNNQIEHKLIFDLLVKHKHISFGEAIKLRGFTIMGFQNNKNIPMNVKDEIIKVWDSHHIFRVFVVPILVLYTKIYNIYRS